MKFALLITAAGSSVRFGAKKEFLPLHSGKGKTTVLAASLETFIKTGLFSVCLITVPVNQHVNAFEAVKTVLSHAKEKNIPVLFTEGGSTRQESVFAGLCFLERYRAENPDLIFEAVMVHDGARPWVSKKIILDAAQVTKKHGAAVPAVPAVDTCKEAGQDGKITRHLRRSCVFAVQTPQSFLFAPLLEAHCKASCDGQTYTDDTEIWATYVGDVYLSCGDYANKKITFAQDLTPQAGTS